MFIKNLKLENIGVFKGKREFNFTKNSNLILAENGHGKSTIVEMLSLLINNSYDGNLESLINNDCDNANAELIFEHNSVEYKNYIEITKKKNTTSKKELYANGELVASGEDVEKYLNKILPKELIKYSLFAKQKGDKITTVSDSDRREILAQLCELDYSKRIKEIIDPQIDFLKNEINSKEKEEYALENKSYNFGEEKEILDVWTDDNEEQLKEFEEKQKLYEKNKELKDKIYELNHKCHDLHDDLERKRIEYNLEKLSDKHDEDLGKLECDHKVNLSEIEENYKKDDFNIDKQIDDINKQISDLEKNLSDIKFVKLIKFNEDELVSARNNLTTLKNKNNYLFEEIKKLEYNLEIINDGKCPYRKE